LFQQDQESEIIMTYLRYASDEHGNVVQGNYNSDGDWVGEGPDPRKSLSVLSEADIELAWQYPAVSSRDKVYLIQNNRVVGKARVISGRCFTNGMYESVTVELDDDAAKEFFKNDYSLPICGKVVGLKYDGVTGRPMQGFSDESENRYRNTEIVDQVDFDFGIAHPRFKKVPYWGHATKTSHLRIHQPQAHRRRRSSNKIKKVR
jgi:hypothetical protein